MTPTATEAHHQAAHRGPLDLGSVEPIPAVALRHAASEPDMLAVVDGLTGERVTRGELAVRSVSLAAGLRARGVRQGDLVAVAMPNVASWPVVALGVWRAGAAVAALSPLWTAGEAARVLEHARPRLGIAIGPLAPLMRGAFDGAGVRAEIAEIDALLDDPGDDPCAPPPTEPGDLAAVLFSSGTGGLPKGVRLTHGNIAAAATTAIHSFGCGGPLDGHAVMLACAPFFHSLGLSLSLCGPLVAGAQIVTMPRPELATLLSLVAEHRTTHVAVPPQLAAALADDPRVDDHDLSSLMVVATGGTHVPAEVERRASERLGCIVRQGYGITEATCIVSAPGRRASTPGTAGWLAAGMEARLVDPVTGEDLPEGEAGELLLRGPQIMEGYHGLPAETRAALTEDGWLRTGDLVAIRRDGQLEVRDRLKELIKVKGASVAPAELELVLRQHPAVSDAGVVGRPDPVSGEAPVAFVTLREPADPKALLDFVAERVAAYKRPRALTVVDELPRSPTGKLLRRELP